MRVNFLTRRANKEAARKRVAKRGVRQWLIERLESRVCFDVTSLVSDINKAPAHSIDYHSTQVGDSLYYVSSSDGMGNKLWRTSGTASGAVLVKDLGTYASAENLTNVNGTLYFSTMYEWSGGELWKSDGTAAGTVLLKDFAPSNPDNPYYPGSFPRYMTNVNGTLYFVANDETSGTELWKSNGTAGGTLRVKDIRPGTDGASPRSLTNVNGTLYFTASDGVSGTELWRSNGSSAGTVRVKDIKPGAGGSSPSRLTNFNGSLYFNANDGTSGYELWKSNGTSAGTLRLKDINSGSDSSFPSELTNVNGTLFFSARDAAGGEELWKSNGTSAGTVRVKDIRSGSGGSSPDYLTEVNGVLYFSTSSGPFSNELWKSNGTADGTVLVKDIWPGSGWSVPRNLTNVNGLLYFTADDGTTGNEIWKSNGTSAGTVRVKDIRPGVGDSSIGELTNFNGTLYFSANDGSHDRELWKSDGTSAGTIAVTNFDTWTAGSFPGQLTNVNGMLYFSTFYNLKWGPTSELWVSDRTSEGTTRLLDLTYPGWMTDVSGTFFVSADNDTNGRELWKSDGTSAGTVLVKDIVPGVGDSWPSHLTNVNGTVFFTADDGVSGQELWKSNGTAAGTVRVKDVNPGPDGSSPYHLTNVNGTLYFIAFNAATGRELWKSDGTAAGTVRVKDINPGAGGSYIKNLTNVNGKLFFSASDGTTGDELWKSDGTSAGTVRVRDIVAGTGGSSPKELTNVNGTLYFSADAAGGRELWKSNGTTAGTVRVKDIDGAESSYVTQLVNANGKLFFVASETAFGDNVWVSNGTDAGTVRLRDINPGVARALPHELVNINGVVFFSANDGTRGFEVWRTDGTGIGTIPVTNISPRGGSSPSQFTLLDNHLVYEAYSREFGDEIWSTFLGLQFSGVAGSVSQGNHLTYTENAIPKQVAPLGRIQDFDSPTFANGRITVRLTSNGHADDRIGILNAGSVSTDSNNRILYNGVVIGVFSGGTGTTPLTITFNSNSTISYAQAVLRSIVYSSVSENPPTATNTYSVTVSRGSETFTSSNQIVVTSVIDVPVLGNVSGSIAGGTNIAYVENAAPVPIARLGTVTDLDSPNFDTGRLTVQFTANANSTDRLGIRGTSTLTVSGNQVRYQGVAFGTFTGGVGTTPLIFTFNANATPGKVQLLLRNIVYSNTSDNPTSSPRTLRVQMTDGDGGTSLARTNQIAITRVNDASTLGNFGGALNYVRNANSIQVSSTATVVDPDSSNFSGGVLTVSITQGSNASNQILVSGGGFSWDASNNLLRNGVIIGTRNAGGGLGTTELRVTLRSTANASVVQDLMRAIRFKTVGSTSTAQRVIAVKLTDGDGGTSNTVGKAINIV